MRIALTLFFLAACRPKASSIPDATADVASAPDAVAATPSMPIFADRAMRVRSIDDVKGTAIVDLEDGRCTIAPDDSAKCEWYPQGTIPLEHEDGAMSLVWMGGAIGGTAPVSAPTFHWGRSFANGRIVYVDAGGKLFVIEKGRAVETKQSFPLHQNSTRFIDGWALWKDTSGEGDARVMALNLADAAAKPIALGTTARPGPFRFYDTCANESARYASMDPNLVVRSKGKWTMTKLEYGRHVSCAADHAILTSGEPLRCDPAGCKPFAYRGDARDAGLELALPGSAIESRVFGSDEALFEVSNWKTLEISIVSAAPGPIRTVALSGDGSLDPTPPSLVVVHGRALVFAHRPFDAKPVVVSVDPTGALKPIVAR